MGLWFRKASTLSLSSTGNCRRLQAATMRARNIVAHERERHPDILTFTHCKLFCSRAPAGTSGHMWTMPEASGSIVSAEELSELASLCCQFLHLQPRQLRLLRKEGGHFREICDTQYHLPTAGPNIVHNCMRSCAWVEAFTNAGRTCTWLC